MKWVLSRKNPCCSFFGRSTYQFSLVIFYHSMCQLLNNCMDSKHKEHIKRLLDTIERITRESNAQAKMEILQMLGMTSQSVIAMAKKLTEPKVKTCVVTKYKEKPKHKKPKPAVKPVSPPNTLKDKPAVSTAPIKPVPPIPPLSNQRSNEAES